MRKDFQKLHFQCPKFNIQKRKTAGKLKCCGMDDRKDVAHGSWKTKKIICGTEGENVASAYGRLPLSAHRTTLELLCNFACTVYTVQCRIDTVH